jgi:hypothetical protein
MSDNQQPLKCGVLGCDNAATHIILHPNRYQLPVCVPCRDRILAGDYLHATAIIAKIAIDGATFCRRCSTEIRPGQQHGLCGGCGADLCLECRTSHSLCPHCEAAEGHAPEKHDYKVVRRRVELWEYTYYVKASSAVDAVLQVDQAKEQAPDSEFIDLLYWHPDSVELVEPLP